MKKKLKPSFLLFGHHNHPTLRVVLPLRIFDSLLTNETNGLRLHPSESQLLKSGDSSVNRTCVKMDISVDYTRTWSLTCTILTFTVLW